MRAKEFNQIPVEYILYSNGRPISRYDDLRSAKGDEYELKKANPQTNTEIKKRVCTDQSLDVNEGLRDPKDNPCWKGYYPVGTKQKNGRTVPNCVPKPKKK